METVTIQQNLQPPRRESKWREFLDNFPIIQFVLAGFIGLAATYTTIQLSQNTQAAEIRRASEKIEQLERDSKALLSRELFDERTKAIQAEQARQREMLEKLLERK